MKAIKARLNHAAERLCCCREETGGAENSWCRKTDSCSDPTQTWPVRQKYTCISYNMYKNMFISLTLSVCVNCSPTVSISSINIFKHDIVDLCFTHHTSVFIMLSLFLQMFPLKMKLLWEETTWLLSPVWTSVLLMWDFSRFIPQCAQYLTL